MNCITADVHGVYTEFHKALDEEGYFTDPELHKLVILGDLFDRGLEAMQMQRFIPFWPECGWFSPSSASAGTAARFPFKKRSSQTRTVRPPGRAVFAI